ncbi:MAG: DUF4426 domain-containing protein [Pseudomonadales bacterium]|jgi:hypothetical protein|nr:DUF4426 domain-containing protein [Pseudomonadales bacterium]
MFSVRAFAIFLLTLSCALLARADSTDIGGYTVHYLAVNSTFLDPGIAAQYGIVRGARQAFINVAVLRQDGSSAGTPVTASISGGKFNLMQQSTPLQFKEVREGQAIYYLAQFDFSNAETLRFEITVQIEGQNDAHKITWSTQLYAD